MLLGNILYRHEFHTKFSVSLRIKKKGQYLFSFKHVTVYRYNRKLDIYIYYSDGNLLNGVLLI